MPTEQTPEATGATPEVSATPTATPPVVEPATGATDIAPEDEQLGPAGLKAYEAEKAARRAAEKATKEAQRLAQDFERRLKELSDKDLSEAEQKDKRLAELEAEREEMLANMQALVITSEVGRLQARLGLVDVDVVSQLLDWDEVDYDDAGRATNIEVLVKDLLKEKPYLGGARPAPAAGINPAGGTSSTPPPRLTTEELSAAKDAGLSPERYEALKSVKTLDEWLATRRT